MNLSLEGISALESLRYRSALRTECNMGTGVDTVDEECCKRRADSGCRRHQWESPCLTGSDGDQHLYQRII